MRIMRGKLTITAGLTASLALLTVWVGGGPAGRYLEAIGAGVDLDATVLFPGPGRDYAYTIEPLASYADYEGAFLPFDAKPILELADHIAEGTALEMLMATGTHDVRDAERILWERGDEAMVPRWIARGLRDANIIYSPESLLSRSFDPELHTDDISHLDCDLASHFFLRVAWHLDLDFREMKSPLHAYLTYRAPHNLATAPIDPDHGDAKGRVQFGPTGEPLFMEPTQFRKILRSATEVDFMGEGLGDGFFIDADFHRNGGGGVRATEKIIERAGYYEPATERDLMDSIVLNVLHGVTRHAQEQGDESLLARVRTQLELHLKGTRSPNLVSNLYANYIEGAERALRSGHPKAAIADADRAMALRESHGQLLLRQEPQDKVIRAQAFAHDGQRDEARRILDEAESWYTGFATIGAEPVATTQVHAQALLLDAQIQARLGVDEYNRLILPVINFERALQAQSQAEDTSERLRMACMLAATALRKHDPSLAREYEQQANE